MKACFSNIRSCRLRAFALPGLRANAANSFLGCLMQCNLTHLKFSGFVLPFLEQVRVLCLRYDDRLKSCFSIIRSCRLRAFALPC
jgi:hypothetical protein